MIIRKATKQDSNAIVVHIMHAMEDIVYHFIGVNDYEKATEFLLHFVQKEGNQYSYENWLVAMHGTETIAAINMYEGAGLELLRAPIIAYVRATFDVKFSPENETQSGEYYIDSLSVSPKYQGKGVGTQLLKFVIEEFAIKKLKTLGLLVDEENPIAKKLYLKLGFKSIGQKILAGKKMEHLQINSEIINS